jgi:hypothetical protein
VEVRLPEYDHSLIALTGLQKKCLEDNVHEDNMAIAHHDDLRLIKDVVRLSQNAGLTPLLS